MIDIAPTSEETLPMPLPIDQEKQQYVKSEFRNRQFALKK